MPAPRLSEMAPGVPIIPVIVVDDVADALPLADALAEGGLTCLELTLRTPAGLPAAQAILAERPHITVGIGTVLSVDDLNRCVDAGVAFTVSPGLTDPLREAVARSPIPHLGGCQTISDAMACREAGLLDIKLFPAALAGGVPLARAIGSVMPDLRICPTGGITADTAAQTLAEPNIFAVGGTWITPKTAIAARDWPAITRLARAATESLT
ncbi:MAG: bifunctional 4-hydroxy-2-oxoglutarate aldolase/2-dehydro-3-deoxy-phosphogluconate aldolase [Devosiaceae bacterium]|nr:bifunctional 4-hydroxy-2-oxoglutarate aldolase/2-dehydro-3-deoxy-phosphogluconate aldolase [Devosiaceae bacterium MH13]